MLLVVASSQSVHCWAGPGAWGSMQTTHRGTPWNCPCWPCEVEPQR